LEGSFEPLPPAGGLGGRGPWVGASGLPGHLTITDNYWIIFRCTLSPHPQARPASGSKRGIGIPGIMARRAGVPRR
jgi:hypothetical protein